MTFTIKHTRSDRPIVAEFRCAVHGRVSLEVQRDEHGDPPSSAACPHGCGAVPFVMSAPRGRVKRVEVARGGYQKAEAPTWTDTTNLGEGQDLDDWHADRDKVWEADREASIKELLDG